MEAENKHIFGILLHDADFMSVIRLIYCQFLRNK